MSASKRLSVTLPAKSLARLKDLKDVAEWSTNAEACSKSFRLTEAMVKEMLGGSVFYIKRQGDAEPTPYLPLMM